MFNYHTNGSLYVDCQHCHRQTLLANPETPDPCKHCGLTEDFSDLLHRAAGKLIANELEIVSLKEENYRAISKRTSPQQVAILEKRIRQLEAQLASELTNISH